MSESITSVSESGPSRGVSAASPGAADQPSAPLEPLDVTEAATAPIHAIDHTLVIEDGVIPRRLRRPLDLARFLLSIVIAGAIVLVAYFATQTAAGIDTDLTTGAALLPSLVVLALNVVGGIGTLGLPIAAAVALMIRGRVRQLFDALLALLIAIILLVLGSLALSAADVPRLLAALAGSSAGWLRSSR
jgi:hypothetical protein